MSAFKGYFSLVQYSPDIARQEAANVGVVLFCPELGFIQAKLSKNNHRIRRFFGEDADGYRHLNAMKSSLAERLKVEASSFVSLEDFQTFIATRANKVLLTAAKPVKVFDPAADLAALYSELVEEPSKPLSIQTQKSLRARLDEILLAQDVRPFVQTDIKIHISTLQEDLEMPFGYQNGRFNLIRPIAFTQQTMANVRTAACKTALEGLSLYRHRDSRLGDLKLVVVADFEHSNPDSESLVKGILAEGSVDVFTPDTLDDLKQEILTNGKPVPHS